MQISNRQELDSIPIKNRESGLELFRIITMLLIVIHHYVVNSGITSYIQLSQTPTKFFFFYCIGAFGKTGINCFVLITGYFMCRSKITLRKFLKLFLEVMFYKITITLTFVIFQPGQWTLRSVIRNILPLTGVTDDFTGCYLIFFLLIPFLNILIKGMNGRQHGLLLLICLTFFSILPNLPSFSIRMNYVTWFMIVYLIGAYIRNYNQKLFARKKLWLFICITCFVLSVSSIFIATYLIEKSISNIGVYFFVEDSNKALAVITAVSSFITFRNLNLRYVKTINTISSATFGVLLIHANCDAMRTWLWRDVLRNTEYIRTNQAYLHFILSIVLIYCVCTIIDLLRIYLIEKPFFNWLDNKSKLKKGEK